MKRLLSYKERIENLFEKNCANDTAKAFENIQLFLETYAILNKDMKYTPNQDTNVFVWENASDIFRAMLDADTITEEEVTRFVSDMISSGGIKELIDRTLDDVLNFCRDGEDYCKILMVLYLNEKTYRGAMAEEMIGFSRSTIQRKKNPAIKLFGILFWQNLKSYWVNSDEEMNTIELEEGRDGSLSAGSRKEIDRRGCMVERRRGDRRRGDRRHGDRRVIFDRRVDTINQII